MNAHERRYAAGDPDGKVYRSVSEGHQIHEYGFDDRPYLGFALSYDVHGDGSALIAHAGGHTTGWVIVFVTLPEEKTLPTGKSATSPGRSTAPAVASSDPGC